MKEGILCVVCLHACTAGRGQGAGEQETGGQVSIVSVQFVLTAPRRWRHGGCLLLGRERAVRRCETCKSADVQVAAQGGGWRVEWDNVPYIRAWECKREGNKDV